MAHAKLIREIAEERKTFREKLTAELNKKSAEISKTFGEPVKVSVESLTQLPQLAGRFSIFSKT